MHHLMTAFVMVMVFCPLDAAEVIILDPSTMQLTFLDAGKGGGGKKWEGVKGEGDFGPTDLGMRLYTWNSMMNPIFEVPGGIF